MSELNHTVSSACRGRRRGASIGADAVLLPRVTVGEGVMVGAGGVVTRNVARNAVVVGNSARVLRIVDNPLYAADTRPPRIEQPA